MPKIPFAADPSQIFPVNATNLVLRFPVNPFMGCAAVSQFVQPLAIFSLRDLGGCQHGDAGSELGAGGAHGILPGGSFRWLK